MIKIFITGGTGFIGKHVLEKLQNENKFHVVILTRHKRDDQKNLSYVQGDISNTLLISEYIGQSNYVIHMAGCKNDPKSFFQTNVKGTEALILAAAETGMKRIIYTSSVATLGLKRDGTPANEETSSSLETMTGHYKRSKFLAEHAVKKLTDEHKLPLVIVNPSTPIGPRDIRPTPTGRIVLDTLCGRMPAYSDVGLNVVHVDDVAQGHILAYKHGKPGERYILGGENMTLLQILQTIDGITGKKTKRLYLPLKLMLPVAWMMEKIAMITDIEPRATVDSIRMAKTRMFYSSEKAMRELGYQFRPAIEAIKDAVIWYQENGYCNPA